MFVFSFSFGFNYFRFPKKKTTFELYIYHFTISPFRHFAISCFKHAHPALQEKMTKMSLVLCVRFTEETFKSRAV